MKKHRLFFAFLVGSACGLGGATLVLLQLQCARLESVLREDFRVVLFLKNELAEGPGKVLEEKLRALPSVEDVRAVSKREALEQLRREEPDLVASLSFLSDNPLNPAYEVKLGEGALGGLPGWLERAEALTEWADVRYRPAQVEAILQAAVFARFIGVALAALVCMSAFLALAGLWVTRGWRGGLSGLTGHLDAASAAGAGGLFGAGVAAAFALPLKSAASGLVWPGPAHFAALALCAAAAGWSLCGLRD